MSPKRPIDAIFSWGSDSDTEEDNPALQLQEIRGKAEGQRQEPCQADKCRGPKQARHAANVPAGVSYQLAAQNLQAGKVLQHCLACVRKLRMATGGESLAIFKIGITHNCEARFERYECDGWNKMLVMFESDELGAIEMLEAALISHYQDLIQCRNVCLGGEGMRDKAFRPKFEPPYFCYCCAARADLPRWVRH